MTAVRRASSPRSAAASRAPAPGARLIGVPGVIGLALVLAGPLGGCASQSPELTPASYQAYSVSAREYGYVRPATDVRIVGRGLAAGGANVGPDADAWDRVRRGRRLGIDHHARTDAAVRAMARNPQYLTGLSQRARPYLHLIVSELERAGLPAELALLPEIESRYNPRAVSHASATGMWQFMPFTGKEMGLVQNGWYDGRNDVLASTRGAIAYLKQLNGEFNGDWALTLAAYNAGPGRVRGAQRAAQAAGRPTDYWSLNLPAETRQYVPKLMAVVTLVRDPARHGLAMPKVENRPQLELIEARSQLDLAMAAAACGVSVQTLRDINPGLKQGRTLPSGPHQLLVPAGSGDKLRKTLAKQGNLVGPLVADARPGKKSRGSRPDVWRSDS